MSYYIPGSTYRLQFNSDFTFADAGKFVSYLHDLGITDVYSSPVFQSQKGSRHGYDIVDHSVISSDLGSEEGFRDLAGSLEERGMGIILDVVPNHMGIVDERNAWWQDVLENGPASRYAIFFDIDWHPPKQELRNRVLLPVLGKQFGEALESGEIRLSYDGTSFRINYYDKNYPVSPRSWSIILNEMLKTFRSSGAASDEQLMELESIVTAIGYLPERTSGDDERREEREREKEVVRRRVSTLYHASDEARDALRVAIEQINGKTGESQSFDLLEDLLQQQAYRLAYWRVASDEINYRRFFDVNELAAIRVEVALVFKTVHELVFRLIREGKVRGLRIDHPDGLFDPYQYFLDLQKGCALSMESEPVETRDFHSASAEKAIWVVVEKILSRHESLPSNWAVAGTTGYEFLNLVNGIFVDAEGEPPLLRAYNRFTGMVTPFGMLVYESKKLVLSVAMAAELHVLARRIDRISESNRASRDFTLWSLQRALTEVIACFPVYRTYARAGQADLSEDDRHHILTAVRNAKRRNRAISSAVFDFIASVLLLEHTDQIDSKQYSARRDFVMRVQQITGPVMAKGLEDTAHYRRYPLASLNEVGGEPEPFGISVADFHQHNEVRAEKWPHSMLTTSTHDTKRSEDIRARLNVLSEIPVTWQKAVTRWHTLNKSKRCQVEGFHVPEPNKEYLIYQTILGIWPLTEFDLSQFAERIKAYIIKAARESKLNTSWIDTNEAYEKALLEFIEAILNPRHSGRFLAEMRKFQQMIAPFGAVNSLAQTVLKITCPGIPDFYQGTELWDFSLVDPDNRRSVDFELRMNFLKEIRNRQSIEYCGELLKDWQDGRIKMYTIHHALSCRNEMREIFDKGSYQPLYATGKASAHVVAFTREHENARVVVVVPRLLARLSENESFPVAGERWMGTTISVSSAGSQSYTNIFTGENVQAPDGLLDVAALFEHFPVAILRAG